MSGSDALDTLEHNHVFLSLSEDELQDAAAQFTRHTFSDGEHILRQGTRPDAIYVVEKGMVHLADSDEEPDEHVQSLRPGDLFGYEEVLFQVPRTRSAFACGDVTVLRWNRAAAVLFLRDHASVRTRMERLIASRELADKLAPDWLGDEETIYGITRRHAFTLARKLILPLFLAFTGLLLLLPAVIPLRSPWIAALLVTLSVLLSGWYVLDWRNDYGIITNRRAVWTEKIIGLYDSQQEAPLSMVLSISVNTTLIGRLLNFGDVLIRTYTGKLSFGSVPDPHGFADLVEEQWRRLSEVEEETDRILLRQALVQRLQSDPGDLPDASNLDEEPVLEPADSAYARWSLRVRFEQDGVITYRKHWAVLLRDMLLPAALILSSLLVWAGHMAGWLTILTRAGANLLALGTVIPLAAFGAYRFIDWSNDLYQITPTHIIDIYRRPLSREMRKVAPVANILGTEVQRRGVFGLLLNYGDVVASVGTEFFTFEGVFNPSVVQQDIVHAQEALLERQQAQARLQRQEEMVELIDIYHEQFASEDGRGKDTNTYDDQDSRHAAQQDPA